MAFVTQTNSCSHIHGVEIMRNSLRESSHVVKLYESQLFSRMSAASRGLALSRLAKKVPLFASASLPSSFSCPSKRRKQHPIRATEPEMGDSELKMESFSHTPEPLEDEEAWNKYQSRWEGTWKDGLKPGERFDACGSAPVFLESLASGKVDVKGKRVVIPGCGRGYDVVESVKAGAAAAVGLEISSAAQKVASAYVKDTLGSELGERGSVVEADFFRWQDPQGGFDVGYDYTFLCALHPSMHPAWAEGWSRILRPGAALVTLMFPINPDRENCGPPWPVSIQLYKDHLLPNGFEFLSAEPVPENLSHPGRGGFEALALWRRLP